MKLTSTRPSDRLNPPVRQAPPPQHSTGKPLQQVELKPKGQTDANS